MLRARAIRFFVPALMMSFTACTVGISQQARDQVTYTGSFAELQAGPQRFRNEVVLAGGKVVETQVADDRTEMVLLQLPLDRRERPLDNDNSQGRFIVRSATFLDPAIYPRGTLVTVVGRVLAGETRAIGQMNYLYPVLDLVEIKKWAPAEAQSPRFHFGIGVGTTF